MRAVPSVWGQPAALIAFHVIPAVLSGLKKAFLFPKKALAICPQREGQDPTPFPRLSLGV